MKNRYILVNGVPKPCLDLIQWAKWMHEAERRVAGEAIGPCWVSTVFLGLDHDLSGKGPPLLWETMVFGGKLDEGQWRCSGSVEQALAMHAEVTALVRKTQIAKKGKR